MDEDRPRQLDSTISAEELHARVTTWETLVREGLHLTWHPQFVDHAIDYVPSAGSIVEIVASEVFLIECARFIETNMCGACTPGDLRAKLLRAANDPQQEFLGVFIAQQTGRAVRALNISDTSPSALEELAATLRYQYVLNAAKYRLGTQLPNGTFRTFGYSAFQVNFIREGWNLIKPGLRSTTSIPAFDADCNSANSSEAQSIAPGWHPTFRITLVETLHHVLAEPIAWEVFYGLMFEDLTLEEIADDVGISAAYISMTVTPGIVSSFQAAFGLAASRNRHAERVKITDMREPLCRLLSKDEFLRLIPRPSLPMPKMTKRRQRSSVVREF